MISRRTRSTPSAARSGAARSTGGKRRPGRGGGIDADTLILFVGAPGSLEASLRIALDVDWTQYDAPFSSAGWFDPDSVLAQRDAISYVKFVIGGEEFDVSVDQVGFY